MLFIYYNGKEVMMLKDKVWLNPNCMFSRQKTGGHGREFPIAAAAYHIFVKQQGKCYEQESEIRYLFSRTSCRRVRQLPETHENAAERGLEKMKYGLQPEREFPFENN